MTDLRQRLRTVLGLAEQGAVPMLRVGPDAAVAHVTEYVSGRYTGSTFDLYGTNEILAITADDVLAVTMLSIQVAQHNTAGISPTAVRELDRKSAQIGLLLAELPGDRDLHTLTDAEFTEWLGPGSPGDALYDLVRRRIGFPRVATHKLLARKRPRLLPIRDTVVEGVLGMTKSQLWWRPWWEAVSGDEEIIKRLGDVRHLAGVRYLSLLRVADIVLWMNGVSKEKQPGSVTGFVDDTSGEP